MLISGVISCCVFYDNSILSGTKIASGLNNAYVLFYDNSILSGTKIPHSLLPATLGFTITQFFQVLKLVLAYLYIS